MVTIPRHSQRPRNEPLPLPFSISTLMTGQCYKALFLCVCVCVQVVINKNPNRKSVSAFRGGAERGTDKRVQMVGSALATS